VLSGFENLQKKSESTVKIAMWIPCALFQQFKNCPSV